MPSTLFDFTFAEMGSFLTKLPEDASVVIFVQKGNHKFAMQRNIEPNAQPIRSWPQAIWDGFMMGVQGLPDPDGEEAQEASRDAGN